MSCAAVYTCAPSDQQCNSSAEQAVLNCQVSGLASDVGSPGMWLTWSCCRAWEVVASSCCPGQHLRVAHPFQLQSGCGSERDCSNVAGMAGHPLALRACGLLSRAQPGCSSLGLSAAGLQQAKAVYKVCRTGGVLHWHGWPWHFTQAIGILSAQMAEVGLLTHGASRLRPCSCFPLRSSTSAWRRPAWLPRLRRRRLLWALSGEQLESCDSE